MSYREILRHDTELPHPLLPARVPAHEGPASRPDPPTPQRTRPHRTWQQILGGLILAGLCVAAAAWYVPQVLRTDRRMLTGSVVSSGVATLNFTSAGEIARVAVHQGEHVDKGQLLATEYAPAIAPVLAADSTAIRSEQSKLASMKSSTDRSTAAQNAAAPTAADIAAVQAQLKLDESQLAADRARGADSRITAPAPGTILAANGRAGEAVTAQGIRDYASDGPRQSVSQAPAFSLLPEGPQSEHRATSSTSTLPVIALRTSSTWQVTALIPESSVAKVDTGERVAITVPAAHVVATPGRISGILPDPVSTADGEEYQAIVTVSGHTSMQPLSGMAADVRLTRGS